MKSGESISNDGLNLRLTGSWVEYKLDFLKRYIDIFETSMRKKWQFRSYIDLLAGPGKNQIKESKKIIDGSPLIALKTKYPFTSYYFNEIDENRFNALKTRVKKEKNQLDVYIFNKDCNEIIDKIYQDLLLTQNKSLNFAFIDPEGMEVKWKTIEKLAKIRRMDILMYYPVEGLNRNMPQQVNIKTETRIDQFFGGAEWRKIYNSWLKKNKTGALHRNLMDLIKKKLMKFGYVDFSYDHFHVTEPLISTNDKNAPLYRLIFASKNQLGHSFWKKIVHKDKQGQLQLFK